MGALTTVCLTRTTMDSDIRSVKSTVTRQRSAVASMPSAILLYVFHVNWKRTCKKRLTVTRAGILVTLAGYRMMLLLNQQSIQRYRWCTVMSNVTPDTTPVDYHVSFVTPLWSYEIDFSRGGILTRYFGCFPNARKLHTAWHWRRYDII